MGDMVRALWSELLLPVGKAVLEYLPGGWFVPAIIILGLVFWLMERFFGMLTALLEFLHKLSLKSRSKLKGKTKP